MSKSRRRQVHIVHRGRRNARGRKRWRQGLHGSCFCSWCTMPVVSSVSADGKVLEVYAPVSFRSFEFLTPSPLYEYIEKIKAECFSLVGIPADRLLGDRR